MTISISMQRYIALISLTVTLTACRSNADRASAASASTTPPTHVDSVVPRDSAIARFQATAIRVGALSGGFTSRDALVRAYAKAIARRDTAALASMAVTRSEFAYLYYPTTPQGLPPYDLAPGLMWFLMETNSRKGLLHALEERSDQMQRYRGYSCPDSASHEGANTVWGPCMVRYEQKPGDVVSERLFSQIIERGGMYKILSFSNKL